MSENSVIWYKNWFNSPYYHVLYKHRDDNEAELFIDNLCAELEVHSNAKILDIACGRGRHAVYLNKKGISVTGIDLSEENIKYASNFANENLHFFVHDMRKNLPEKNFDYVLNLFTSFGYFENESDNPIAMKAFANSLKKGGKFVIDFMNVKKLEKNLVEREVKEISGIEFHITRKIENNSINKEIIFEDRGRSYHFNELVRALTMKDFEKYFKLAELQIEGIYGDYNLSKFDEKESDRLIYICKK